MKHTGKDSERRILGEGVFLRLLDKGTWEFTERKKGSAVVAIVAVVKGCLVLVEQYRPALDAHVIELPAGLVGDEAGRGGEAIEEAARRELIEETGYSAENWQYLTEGPPSSGMSSEIVTFLRATGLRRVEEGGGVHGEDIVCHEVPLKGAEKWLAARMAEGILIDPKVYAGIHFALQAGENTP